MSFTIKNDLLFKDGRQVAHYTTRKTSGRMKVGPKYVVIHYTAGIRFQDDIRVLSSSSVEASCQLVMDKDGTVAQIGDFKDILWHAGRSKWDGISGLNSHSVGIEVTNPGWVDFAYEKDGVKYFKYPTANGKGGVYWNDRDDVIIYTKHRNGGPAKYWVQFSQAQLEALYEVCMALKSEYNIKEVVGHDMIAPDRKIDPGPCLPADFYGRVNGGAAKPAPKPAPVEAPKTQSPLPSNVYVTTANLNLRAGSSTSSEVLKVLAAGTHVIVDSQWNGWSNVYTMDRKLRGFVSSQYLKRA